MAFHEGAIEYVTSVCSNVRNYFERLREAVMADVKGWTICACVLLITVVRSGITYSFGVFVVQLEHDYHKTLAEQNWIGTLSFCISLSFAPVSVAVIRALKYRGYRWGGLCGVLVLSVSCMSSSFVYVFEWMFLTHSILYGVGSSLIYMASSLVIGEHFDKNHKYHVLATSILLCGYPVGSLLFNPINAWLVTRFGWRVAFRVSSVLIFFTGIGCCWCFSAKETPNMERLDEREEVDEVQVPEEEPPKIPRKCCTLSEVKDRPEIVLWYCGNLLSYLGFFMPFINLAYYMKIKGITTLRSSWALTLLSLAECITYIFASFMGDYLKGKLIYINIAASAALSLICILWPSLDVSYSVILFISICMGGCLGLTIVYTYAASGEVTQLPIDIAWSFTNLWSGLGILLGPLFSGVVFDLRKSYDDVFYVVGCLYILDTIIFGLIPIIQKWRARKEMSNEQMNKLDYNEIAGVIGDGQKQTFKVPQRSISKNSLTEGKADGAAEYGTTASTAQPQYNGDQPTEHGGWSQPPNGDRPGRANGYGGYGYNYSEN